MAKTKTPVNQTNQPPEVCKYKTAAAEERAMTRRLNAHWAKRQKEMEGMTNKEKAEYMNWLGQEAAIKMGITKYIKVEKPKFLVNVSSK